jgi:hypothetical protein
VTKALEMFKQGQAALGDLLQLARAVLDTVTAARNEIGKLTADPALRELLEREQKWLARTEAAVTTVRAWRYKEEQRYGAPLAWRWAVATTFALLAATAAGAGYGWASRPYADEIAYLRSRNTFADALESRMLRMTPLERRQLNALLQLPTGSK